MTAQNQKWVIVTGASGGLGAAIVRELAADGYGIVALARSRDKLDQLSDDLQTQDRNCLAIGCDITNSDSLAAAVSTIARRDLTLAGLVNNAGAIEPIAPVLKADPDLWAGNVATNLISVHRCIHAFAPLFPKEPAATIVNISSGASQRPLEGWSAYCASKAGLAMLTQSLHLEASERFFTYGFQPGLIDTQMQEKIRQSGINPVSAIPQANLLPATDPAQMVAWLFKESPQDLRGKEFRADDNDVRTRAGLPPLTA